MVKAGLVALLIGVTIIGGLVSRDQWIAYKAESFLRERIRLDSVDAAAVARIEAFGRDCVMACGSRVDIARAAALVVRGQRETDPGIRRAVLNQSVTQLSDIARQDPALAEVWIWWTRARILTGEGDALQMLERSYRVKPFDRTHALWRISVVNDRWADASPGLRVKTLDEAFWYGSVFPPFARNVTAVVSNPSARLALTLRRKSRVGHDQSPERTPIP
ncbi:hypothetical protein BZG35_05650 [Brevundimonas sp. LM2]|nr:hypothetical protein BZG35_05650 [Brevundimonas sp. LM2]